MVLNSLCSTITLYGENVKERIYKIMMGKQNFRTLLLSALEQWTYNICKGKVIQIYSITIKQQNEKATIKSNECIYTKLVTLVPYPLSMYCGYIKFKI